MRKPSNLTARLILLLLLPALASCAAKTGTSTQPAKPQTRQVPIEELDPGFLYLAAQDAIKNGRLDLAIRMLETLVAKDPAAVEPGMQLLELLMQRQQWDKAEAQLRRLQAMKPEQMPQHLAQDVAIMAAELEYHRGHADKALKLLDAFLSRHTNDIRALELKLQILVEQKRTNEAIGLIRQAIRIQDTPRLRMLQAQLLMQQGQTKAAGLALEKMRQLDPDDDTPVLMQASLAIREKRFDEAEALLREFLMDHPDAMRVSNALGRLLVQQNRIVEAILIYRDLEQKTGGEPAVMQALGLLYYQHRDYRQSAETFRKLLAKKPSDEARFYLAASLEELDQAKEAQDLYRQIDTESALYTEAQMRLARLDAMAGNNEAAARRLKDIIRKHPKLLAAYSMLSSIRISQKAYRKVLEETEPTLAIRRLPPQLLFNRAVAFDHFRQYDQVEATLQRLLEHDSNHAEALNFLGYTYAVQGIKLDEAEALVRRALAQKPDDGYYLDSLAWIQFKRGDVKTAIATQKQALEKVADDPVMHEHMGDMLEKDGQLEAARREWQLAIRLKHEDAASLRRKISASRK